MERRLKELGGFSRIRKHPVNRGNHDNPCSIALNRRRRQNRVAERRVPQEGMFYLKGCFQHFIVCYLLFKLQ